MRINQCVRTKKTCFLFVRLQSSQGRNLAILALHPRSSTSGARAVCGHICCHKDVLACITSKFIRAISTIADAIASALHMSASTIQAFEGVIVALPRVQVLLVQVAHMGISTVRLQHWAATIPSQSTQTSGGAHPANAAVEKCGEG